MGKYPLGRKKLTKTGGSLRVIIPKSVIDEMGIEAGDEAELVFDEDEGVVIIRFPKAEKKGGVKK